MAKLVLAVALLALTSLNAEPEVSNRLAKSNERKNVIELSDFAREDELSELEIQRRRLGKKSSSGDTWCDCDSTWSSGKKSSKTWSSGKKSTTWSSGKKSTTWSSGKKSSTWSSGKKSSTWSSGKKSWRRLAVPQVASQKQEERKVVQGLGSQRGLLGKKKSWSTDTWDCSTICETPSPTAKPTEKPTGKPTAKPTEKPTAKPTEKPTTKPTEKPTSGPTDKPTNNPTGRPTANPTDKPTFNPTEKPTGNPTDRPTFNPTDKPSATPTDKPTVGPTERPSDKPTGSPTERPSSDPTGRPTESPSVGPTTPPSQDPTQSPTDNPSEKPTDAPSDGPTSQPTPRCEENTDYFILGFGWEVYLAQTDRSIILSGRYDQDGEIFYNDDNNMTIWFEKVGTDYAFVIGDYDDIRYQLYYVDLVSTWTDSDNPLVDSEDESEWEPSEETLEYVTSNMTLYDCEGENLGTDVYTQYSHVYYGVSAANYFGAGIASMVAGVVSMVLFF